MAMFRSAADRTIDRAHNAIACAEMAINHSFTDTDVPETDDIGMTLSIDGRVYMHGHRDD